MSETAVRRLLAAADEDGVDCDGLRVEAATAGYRFRTPEIERDGLSESALRDVAADHSAYVTNWHFWEHVAPDAPADRAYLRWLEGADETPVPERYERLAEGTGREWGQLRLSVEGDDDGDRRYEVRHVDDVDAPVGDLERHEDPLDARELAKRDDRGRYRPLKTAPTLRDGWVFADLDPGELVSTVDFVYPATVVNWHREREGDLDVDHWTETMGRQSGIYGVIETWNRQEGHEHVNWVAEACCDDSQCLKRREWEYDDETDLDVDGGDGAFPCREPCSLVVSAARQWTKLEGEESRTYEFELTPSEKDQLEAIVDAVADGRTEEIREADVYEGANRYRTRYLRAKLFDDEGNLCGVETED
ncbi:DR2241 family protein [Halorientalis halophila]|uniref:DR2241 family protein n=1 Tax=Halorientalis halophila TaxID=3108499 RepID=UPI003009CFD1